MLNQIAAVIEKAREIWDNTTDFVADVFTRLFMMVIGPALLCVWWYFAPDYQALSAKPLGSIPVGELIGGLFYFIIFILLVKFTIESFYEACTNRDGIDVWD